MTIYPYLLSYVLDNFSNLEITNLIFIGTVFIVSVILILLFSYLKKIFISKYKKKILYLLRIEAYKSIQNRDFARFHLYTADYYSSFLTNDLNNFYVQYYENLAYGCVRIVSLLVYLIVLCFINLFMSLIVFGTVLLVVFVPYIVGRKYEEKQTDFSNMNAEYLERINELLGSHNYISVNNKEIFQNMNNESLVNMHKSQYSLDKYNSFIQIFSGSTLYVQLIIVFVSGLLMLYFNLISSGVLACTLIFTDYIAAQMTDVVDIVIGIRGSKAYKNKIDELLVRNEENIAETTSDNHIDYIILNDIEYQVNDGFKINIDHLKFDYGKKYLIVGDNGSGKSSLLRLISNIYVPSSGEIIYKGYNGTVYYNLMSFMTQERYIFNSDILSNISLFDKEIDTKIIEKMASEIRLYKDENELTGRNGSKLSGGQIAKICLLRELLKNKPIVLLDEPFNDVDEESINDILEYILKQKSTFIIVAHYIPSKYMDKFDEIINMKDGKCTS